jgi:hypothetical protein
VKAPSAISVIPVLVVASTLFWRAAVSRVEAQAASPWIADRAVVAPGHAVTRDRIDLLRGMAVRPDLMIRDGVIEVTIGPPTDAFAGLAFRVASTADYEIVYFRPSDDRARWAAVQYQPVYQGETTWQLYHGDGYEATLPLSATGALRVRLAIAGRRADVSIAGVDGPILRIRELKRDVMAGAVGVWASPSAKDVPATTFSALRVDASMVPKLDDVPAETAPETQLIRWRVSGRYPSPHEVDPPLTLPADLDVSKWPTITAEASGLVNLTRVIGNPAGAQVENVFGGAGWGLAFAHVTIASEQTEMRQLFVSYSDGIGVYLSGQLLYTGNNADGARTPDNIGIVGAEREGIYLPLVRGQNELVLAITDKAFGWGFRARLESMAGLQITP